jgi:ABC-type branched-subunit amino acid transport system substrate-binding protein
MAVISVETASMARLSERIRQAAAEARSAARHPGPLRGAVRSLSVPCLVQAAGAFVEAWSAAIGELVDDAERLADAVDAMAALYQAVESANAGRAGAP